PMIIASSNVLVAERTVYERERLAGLNILPYVTARLWVLFLLGGVVVVLHVPITYYWCDLADGSIGGLAQYMFVGFLTTSTASAMGMALSAAVSNPVSALWGINFLVIPQLLVAGSIGRLQQPACGLGWLPSARCGLEALTVVDLKARTALESEENCLVSRYLANLPNFHYDGFVYDHPLLCSMLGMGTITF